MKTTTKISWQDINEAAASLGIEPCAMQAVCEVESAGSGFLASGRPKILFEGHIFWRELQKQGIDPEKVGANYPGILYPKWTKSHYKGGEKEYDRLNEAMTIHEEAALSSASWGAFQIMGYNFAACGYVNVHDFVKAQKKDAAAQLAAFCAFISHRKLVVHLKNKDWTAFAKGYNGPAYAQNQYDTKLAEIYRRCLATSVL